MKKLRKMTPEEYTVPAGNECSHPSRLDVLNICMKHHINFEHINLTKVESAKKSMILWFGHNDNDENAAFFTLFKEDEIPAKQKVEIAITKLEEGEYLFHKKDVYQILSNPDLGTVVRKVTIYASALEADVSYRFFWADKTDQTTDLYPEFNLVRLTENDKPEKTLCYAWHIEKENHLFLQPIFCEDETKFFNTNRNNLNWEFLHEGDSFWHDNRAYQVCKDENDDYYIAPFCPAMQVIKCNL